ncbi:FeoA family protein [Amnimonas aquatica]|uniref:Ferrous iron transport protein A n=1 Tax=Amnimonas aquatica TaxID=2094561 RepID=A0A2P6AR62_9GAMM|nr:FeoA family protein [Amnimonas aquatica]PQA35539.1 ferrous iron transport protein A [Amnimonas aquatica]
MRLSDLPRYATAIIQRVEPTQDVDPIARRLADLGFVPGETVRLTATGPIGADPLLVQVGFTRFALRRSEAARVIVEVSA